MRPLSSLGSIAIAAFAMSLAFGGCGSGGGGSLSSLDPDGGSNSDGATRTDGGKTDAALVDGATASGCHKNAECRPGFETCDAPDQPVCGGAAAPEQCQNDGECADAGTNFICLFHRCSGSQCVAKCTSDDYCQSKPAGLQKCDTATGHCVAKPCTDTSCPTNYVCGAGGAGCTRKPCQTDAECTGACVNNLCWAGVGHCFELPS